MMLLLAEPTGPVGSECAGGPEQPIRAQLWELWEVPLLLMRVSVQDQDQDQD